MTVKRGTWVLGKGWRGERGPKGAYEHCGCHSKLTAIATAALATTWLWLRSLFVRMYMYVCRLPCLFITLNIAVPLLLLHSLCHLWNVREISHGNLIVSIVRSSFKLGLLPLPLLLFRMFVAVTAETRKTMLGVLWGQRVRFLYLWSSFAVLSPVVVCVCGCCLILKI